MSIAETVYRGLMADRRLISQLHRDCRGRCIYHGRSPDAGSYPILVYSVISDVPALSADGAELERRVTVRIHVLTKDGVADSITDRVNAVMCSLGFVRAQSLEMAERNFFVNVIDYRIGVES